MQYFELFGIPVQLVVDKDLIRRKYFELSKQSHPDYFVNGSTDEQQQSLEASAQLNKAYKTLGNPETTIQYVLKEKGLLQDDEKYALPPAFLMEMMELNEAVADAAMEGDTGATEQVTQQLKTLQEEIYEPVKCIVADYKEGITTEEELLQVKEYYFKKKYLQRLAQQLGQKL